MTTFNNHAPINFSNATIIASASRDGGAYSGIGYDNVLVMQGKNMIHVYREYSSGCVYHGQHSASSEVNYLFGARTKEELIAWLLQKVEQNSKNAIYESECGQDDPNLSPLWAANELLSELGYQGVEA